MSVLLQDRVNEPLITPGFSTTGYEIGSGFTSPVLAPGGDAISRMLDPNATFGSFGGTSPGDGSGGLYQIVQQLMSVIRQLLGQAGWSGSGSQQFFANATGGSNGDPHLSFNGTTWNDMQSQGDLLASNSMAGGFRISTQTTPPNANGITYNQQATVTTNFGNTTVSLERSGNATYTQFGITNELAPGQTVNLGNGETAARNPDGSLTVTTQNPEGGCITTTMTENGNGVNVNVTAHNVDLGGTLVGHTSTPQPPPERPVLQRYAAPAP